MELERINKGRSWAFRYRCFLWPVVVLVVGFFVLWGIYTVGVQPQEEKPTRVSLLTSTIGDPSSPINNEQVVEQIIECDKAVSSFSLPLATYNKTLYNIIVKGSLQDAKTGEMLGEFAVRLPQMKDNDYQSIALEQPVKAESGQLRLSFFFTGLYEEEHIAVWLSAPNQESQTTDGEPTAEEKAEKQQQDEKNKPMGPPAFIENQEQAGPLVVDLFATSGFLANYYWLLAGALLFLAVVGLFLALWERAKPQHFFLLAGSLLGLVYLFIYTPYTMPDDSVHMGTSIYYADLLSYGGEEPLATGVGMWESRATDEIYQDFSMKPSRQAFYLLHNGLFQPDEAPGDTARFMVTAYGEGYQYFPQVLGVLLGRLLGLGGITTLYLGRLFGLAVYIAAGYFAIKITPFKTLFTMVCLAPYALRVGGSFSYDNSILVVAFLLIALLLHQIYEADEMPIWQMVVLLALVILLVPPKYVYAPVALLMLLIPKENWPWFKARFLQEKPVLRMVVRVLAVLGIVAALAAVVFLVWQVVQGMLPSFAQETNKTPTWLEEAYSLGLIVTNPLEFIRLLVATAGDTAVNLFTGLADYASVDLRSYTVAGIGFFLMLRAVSPVQGAGRPLVVTAGQKSVMAFVLLLCYVAVLVISITWTEVGSYYIDGIGPQARYYLPLLPLMMLLFHGVFLRKKNDDRMLLYGFLLLNGYAALSVFVRGAAL